MVKIGSRKKMKNIEFKRFQAGVTRTFVRKVNKVGVY
jgi:hypothetical protein